MLSAISSGPGVAAGPRSRHRLPEPAGGRPAIGVSTGPGATTLSRTPNAESSLAAAWLSACAPAFEAAYGP